MPNSSVKDEKLYQKLRKKGDSQEKAARVANASAGQGRSKVAAKGGKSGDYDDWTVDELRKHAAELDIPGRSTMAKGELVKALRDH